MNSTYQPDFLSRSFWDSYPNPIPTFFQWGRFHNFLRIWLKPWKIYPSYPPDEAMKKIPKSGVIESIIYWWVVSTYPSEKYESVGIIIPNWIEKLNSCSKPPARLWTSPDEIILYTLSTSIAAFIQHAKTNGCLGTAVWAPYRELVIFLSHQSPCFIFFWWCPLPASTYLYIYSTWMLVFDGKTPFLMSI